MANHLMNVKKLCLGAVAMAVTSIADLGPTGITLEQPAYAVVGRPLTPVSYAGVARRTARRTARRNVAYTSGAMTTLPAAGCVPAGGVYSCGGVRYRQYYDGPNLVYVEVH